jgi:LPXTG-motif cell wall-anchored protein
MVWSGTEWYLNSAGLMVAETTLGVGPFNWGEVPSFVRIRKAVQYASSIDEFASIMLQNSNGAYCGDYLVGDAKTNEAAIVELGGKEYEIARTDNGYLRSCNYPWDPEVAAEMGATQGPGHSCYPRYVRWEQLLEANYGNITPEMAMEMIGDHYDTETDEINPCGHTLCGHVENASGYPHGSLDAKVATTELTLRMETWGRFGHSCGRDFVASDHAAANPDYAFPNLKDMIHEGWRTYSAFSEVEVFVQDSEGYAVSGAEVSFVSRVDGTVHLATSDEQGIAHFEYLPHSEYYLNASKGNDEASRTEVVSEPVRLEITVKEGDTGELSDEMQAALAALGIVVLLAVPAGWFYLKKKRNN